MPLTETSEVQRLAGRDPAPQVTALCVAHALDLNRLNYIKWLVVNAKITA